MAAGGFGVAGVAGVQIGGGAGVQIGGGAGGGPAGACAGQENVVANGIGGAAPMANAGVVGFGFGFSFADQPLVSQFSSVAKRLVSHFSCSAPLLSRRRRRRCRRMLLKVSEAEAVELESTLVLKVSEAEAVEL